MLNHFLSGEVIKVLASIPPAWWFWMWVAAYGAGAILLLWVLTLVKNVAGWAGVVGVLLLVTYGFAYTRGALHQSINPFDNPRFTITETFK